MSRIYDAFCQSNFTLDLVPAIYIQYMGRMHSKCNEILLSISRAEIEIRQQPHRSRQAPTVLTIPFGYAQPGVTAEKVSSPATDCENAGKITK